MERVVFILVVALLFNGAVWAQNADSTYDVNAVYELSLEDLMNVKVVTASKSEEDVADAPGVVSVVTKDEIARYGGISLSSLLERVAGLTASTNYLTERSTLASRGDQITSTSSHVLLLINGKPVREVLEGGLSSEMYESFPITVIEQIEIIKGPGSVLYGSNAFSGVINIITHKADTNGASITGLGGQGSAYGSLVDVKIKKGDLNVVAAGRYVKRPTWNVAFDRANGASVYSKMVDIPNDGIGSFLGANFKNFSCMSSYNQWNNFGATSRGSGNVYWKKFFNNLAYDGKITDSWKTSASIVYTQSKFDADSFPKNHRNSFELLTECTNYIQISDKSKLVVGGLYILTKGKEYNTLSGTEVVSSDAKRNAYGGYAQMDYSILKKVKLIGGVQANKIENVSVGIVPRAGVIVRPVEKFNIKLLYGQAFRAPSLNEVSLVASTLRGNSNLKPEKVANVDFAIGYSGETMHLGVNYFYSSMTDIIFTNRTFNPAMYDNIGKATIQGAEFEGKVYLSKQFLINASTLYQQSKDDNGNKIITPIPNVMVKGGVSYQSTNGITASLFNIYQGSLDSKFDTKLNPSPKSFNKLDLHLNFNLNSLLSLTYKTKFNVFAHAENMLNQTVWLPMWGTTAGNSMPYNQGRFVYGGINISF